MLELTNRETLKQLKTDYGLTSQQVADIMGRSLHTVRSWLNDTKTCKSARLMDDRELEYLKFKLRSRKKVNK